MEEVKAVKQLASIKIEIANLILLVKGLKQISSTK